MMELCKNHGAPWCGEQDKWLLKAIKKYSSEECAKLMERTVVSIESRLVKLACDMIQKGMTIDDVCNKTKANLSDIERSLNKMKDKTTKKSKTSYYAVRRGHVPGIYQTWEECLVQIKGFTGTSFKKFKTKEEAEAFLEDKKNNIENTKSFQSQSQSQQTNQEQLPTLSDEQQHVLSVLFEEGSRRSVFLTGPAGTGKSVTLHAIVQKAYDLGLEYGITAMTGTAGYLIGGSTLHSFLGIGTGNEPADYMAAKIRVKNKSKYDMLCELDLLIIDEVSMLDDDLFTNVSKYLQIIRDNKAPFGGVQLVLCGDMCQLQPVSGNYCFLCEEWKRLNPYHIILTKIFRQDGDHEFIKILMELRYGRCSDEILQSLIKCKHTEFPDDIVPTRMYSLNKDVDQINDIEISKLLEANTLSRIYKTSYVGSKEDDSPWTTSVVKQWAVKNNIPDKITLCEGAQVVVTRNMKDMNVFNGTRGVIQQVMDHYILIKTLNSNTPVKISMIDIPMENDPSAYVRCMPVKYAWAISIHKSQGMTLDCVEMDLGNSVFAYGQAYTALSRARNLSSVRIVDINPFSFRTHPDVLALYLSIK